MCIWPIIIQTIVPYSLTATTNKNTLLQKILKITKRSLPNLDKCSSCTTRMKRVNNAYSIYIPCREGIKTFSSGVTYIFHDTYINIYVQ